MRPVFSFPIQAVLSDSEWPSGQTPVRQTRVVSSFGGLMRVLPLPIWTWVRDCASKIRRWWVTPVPPIPAVDLTPYVAEFDIPTGTAVPVIKPNDHKGLLYIESIGGIAPHTDRLLTVWRDQGAYNSALNTFLHLTGLPPASWIGYHRDTISKLGFWKQLSWGWVVAALATIAGIVGNLQTISDSLVSAFAPPEFEVANVAQPYNFLVGTSFNNIEARIHNTRQRAGDCTFTLEKVVVSDTAGVTLDDLSDKLLSGVKQGEERKVSISGRCLVPGKYFITLKGNAKSGWLFSRNREINHSIGTIRIWDPLGIDTKGISDLTPDSRICRVACELAPGRDSDEIEVSASLFGEPGVRLLYVLFNGVNKPVFVWPTSPSSKIHNSNIVWITPKLKAYRAEPFTLVLTSDTGSRPREEWDRISKKIKFETSTALKNP